MSIYEVKKYLGNTFGMSIEQAEIMDDFLKKHKLTNILELGFAHGVSSCYFASIIEDMGEGHLTTIDLNIAKTRNPNIETLSTDLDLKKNMTIFYENKSYTWRLMKMIEENEEPIFDFCYVDGAHDWYNDGFAFLLVDKLLKPGGWIFFDDMHWTYDKSPSLKDSDFVKAMTEEERTTPQISKVYYLLVKKHPDYQNFGLMCNGNWGIAQKREK